MNFLKKCKNWLASVSVEILLTLLTVSITLHGWSVYQMRQQVAAQQTTINQLVENNNKLTEAVNALTERVSK